MVLILFSSTVKGGVYTPPQQQSLTIFVRFRAISRVFVRFSGKGEGGGGEEEEEEEEEEEQEDEEHTHTHTQRGGHTTTVGA